MKSDVIEGLITYEAGFMPAQLRLRMSVDKRGSTLSISDAGDSLMYTVAFEEVIRLYEEAKKQDLSS